MDNEQIRQTLMAAGIDYDTGLRRMMGKESLYYRFLKKFPEDPNCAGLIESISHMRVSDAFEYAHALKGVALNLGLRGLYIPLSDLVECLRSLNKGDNQRSDAVLAALTKDVRRAYERTVQAIRETLG